MNIRYLLDEHVDPVIIDAVLLLDETVDIQRVGDELAPPLGTKDPELLLWCERERCILVTDNRKSMPGHVADHYAVGHEHWGIFRIRPGTPLGALARELHLFWVASDAEEWRHAMEWIPY
jgi:hypothetical protein